MKKSKFQLKKERTYANLMKYGMEILCEKGFSTTTIDEISNRAGYSKGAFYVHFESKEDFFKQVIEFRQANRTESLETKWEQIYNTEKTLEGILLKVVEALFSYIKQSPEWIFVYIDFYMQAKDSEIVSKTYQQYYRNWIAETSELIDWLKKKNLISKTIKTEEAAKDIYAFLDGYFTHYNLYNQTLSAQRVANVIVKLLT